MTIVFERDSLVHASSDNSPVGSRLGEILVEQGALSVQELNESLRTLQGYRSARRRVGVSLEKGEFISPECLHTALTTQIKRLLGRTFSAQHAKFALREGKLGASDRQLSLNVMELLLAEARERDEARR